MNETVEQIVSKIERLTDKASESQTKYSKTGRVQDLYTFHHATSEIKRILSSLEYETFSEVMKAMTSKNQATASGSEGTSEDNAESCQ